MDPEPRRRPWRPALTRRDLVRAAAGVLGASLLDRVPTALASSSPVFAVRLGPRAAGASGVLRAPRPFALLGVQWRGAPDARVRVRVHGQDGAVSPWFDATPRHGGAAEPIWIGAAQRYELRTSVPLEDVKVHFVAPERTAALAGAAAALPRLQAGPGQPAIVTRSAWATPACAPRRPPEFGDIALGFVHHTEGVNSYGPAESASMVQSICLFHENVNGWNDIGYNFLVDRYGQIFEGRAGGIDEPVAGAQAGGFNFFSTGVSMMGSFITELPPPPALRALEKLLAWKLSLHGVPNAGRVTVRVSAAGASYTAFAPGQAISLRRISGHRDGDQTDCPGDRLYAELPAVRSRVATLAGPTLGLTLAVAHPAGAAASAATPLIAAGVLRVRGGAPLPGAPIEIQRRRETGVTTLARTDTGPDGSWSVAVRLRENATLRALHRPAPAVISRAVDVAVAPAITLAATGSRGSILARGTVAPSKRSVTINLYAVHRGAKTTLISRTRARVTGTGFEASIRVTAPGTYRLSAHTSADSRNAAGRSAPASLTV